jgi:2-oxoglutarate dehydrogenase E1 component
MTPKGALRAPAAASPLADLTQGRFQVVLADDATPEARSILVATGKILHELRAERERRGRRDVAIIGLEQIYPFPADALGAALRRHATAEKIVWVQEEPANMGALAFVRPLLQRIADDRPVTSVKRHESASPATGSPKAHALEQSALYELAFAKLT